MSKKKEEVKIDGQVEAAILALIDAQVNERLNSLGVVDGVLPPKEITESDGPADLEELREVIKNDLEGGGKWNDMFVQLISDVGQETLDNYDFSGHIENINLQEYMDMSDIASDVEDYIDWDCRISDNIDVGSEIQNFIDGGCGAVDDYCKKIVQRGTGGDSSNLVTITKGEYTRIMEVVDFIRPVRPADPTPKDLAGQLIAQVQPGDAIELVTTATIEKAQADAQAIVDNAVAKAGDSE